MKFETISTKFVCSFWKVCIGIPFEWVFYPLIILQHVALVVSITMVEWFMQNFQMLTSNITNHIHWFHYQSHQKSLIYWESFMFTVADVSLPKIWFSLESGNFIMAKKYCLFLEVTGSFISFLRKYLQNTQACLTIVCLFVCLPVVLSCKSGVPWGKVASSAHHSNNYTGAFPQGNHHTSIYHRNALCTF